MSIHELHKKFDGLREAIERRDMSAVRTITKRDSFGQQYLTMYLVLNLNEKHHDITLFLLACGADPFVIDHTRSTFFEKCFINNSQTLICKIVEFFPRAVTELCLMTLRALINNDIKMFERLMKHVDPMYIDTEGRTIAENCIVKKNKHILEILIRGCEPQVFVQVLLAIEFHRVKELAEEIHGYLIQRDDIVLIMKSFCHSLQRKPDEEIFRLILNGI